MRFTKESDGRLRVVDATQNGFEKRSFQVEEIVNAQSVTDADRHIAHARQIFAKRNHIRPVFAPSQKKPSMCQNDQRPLLFSIVGGPVDVHAQFLVGT